MTAATDQRDSTFFINTQTLDTPTPTTPSILSPTGTATGSTYTPPPTPAPGNPNQSPWTWNPTKNGWDYTPYTAGSNVQGPAVNSTVEFNNTGKSLDGTGVNAEALLNKIASGNLGYYDKVFRPRNQQVIKSIGQNTLEKGAGETVGDAAKTRFLSQSAGMEARNRARYGQRNDVVDQRNARVMADLGFSKFRSGTLEKAREADYNRDQSLTDAMVNAGRGLDAVSTKDLTTAAQGQNATDTANANIDAQNQAAQNQMIGTVLSIIAMAI